MDGQVGRSFDLLRFLPRGGLAFLALALAGCAATRAPAPEPSGPRVVLPAGASAVAASAAGDALVVALGPMGMLVADPGGAWTSRFTGEEVTAGAGGLIGEGRVLFAAADEARGLIKLSASDRGAVPKEKAGTVAVPFAPRHLCVDPAGFLFVGDSSGIVRHYRVLFEPDGRAPQDLRLVRAILIGGETDACAVSAGGDLLVLEPGVGVWRMASAAERDGQRSLIAAEPPGGQAPTFAGLAAAGAEVLAFTEAGEVWTLLGERPARTAQLASGELVGLGVIGKEAIAVSPDGALTAFPFEAAPPPSRDTPAAAVAARGETAPVPSAGDAADDPAIWRHPEDLSQSLILGTNKQSGLEVYDLSGERRQRLKLGRINNVDLRQGAAVEGGRMDIAAATNRTDKTIQLFRIDRASGEVATLGAFPAGLDDPYGLCLHSGPGGLQVIATGGEGEVRQWRVRLSDGAVAGADLVREGRLSSVAEGCVVDDAAGVLFLAEENVGLWRIAADPETALETRMLIDRVKPEGRLTADVEGVAIMPGANGSGGYLVVSSQGADTYLVYDRAAPHAYRGTFEIVANVAGGVDGASETDGLETAAGDFGPDYPEGLLVVQDGRNVEPPEAQNFKLVSWAEVKAALGLE